MNNFDDVEIGDVNDKGTLTVTVKQYGDELKLSENTGIYRAADVIAGIGITIDKSSPEGQELKKMIDNNFSRTDVELYLIDLVLHNVNPLLFVGRLDEYCQRYYEAGKEAKVQEMLNVLNVQGLTASRFNTDNIDFPKNTA